MPLVADAVRGEFRKLDKPINEADFRRLFRDGASRMNVRLHIERLVFDGLPVAEAGRSRTCRRPLWPS